MKSKGFTLIELLIAMAIIGIIAAIAIPNLLNAIEEGDKGTLEERWVATCVANTVERDGEFDKSRIIQQCQLIWDMGVKSSTPMIVPELDDEG